MPALGGLRQAALGFYTAVFCIDFLSEVGLTVDRDSPIADDGRINCPSALFEALMRAQ